MTRGLNPRQRSTLLALEAYPREQDDGGGISRLAASTELIRPVCREPTPNNRTAMSRVLARLLRRGLVEVWSTEVKLSGDGRQYCLPGRVHLGPGSPPRCQRSSGVLLASREQSWPNVKWPRRGLESSRGQALVREDKSLVLQGGALVIPHLEDAFPHCANFLGRPRQGRRLPASRRRWRG